MSLKSLLVHEPVQKFLQDGDVYRVLKEIAEKYTIDENRVDEFLDLTDAVLDGQLALADMPEMLKEAFGKNEEEANQLAIDIVGIRLLPLEVFFPGVEKQIIAWGGEVGKFERKRVGREQMTIDDLATQVADKAGVDFSDLLMKRLAFLLEQRMANQKTDDALRTFFGRPLTIGGLGLPKEQIDALMSAIAQAVDGVEIVVETPFMASREPEPEPEDENEPETKNANENVVESKAKTPFMESHENTMLEIAPSHEVAAEVPVVSSPERARQIVISQESSDENVPDTQSKKKADKAKKLHDEGIKTAFAEAIDLALREAETVLQENNVPSSAFADIVGKMLRGIRDQYQTRDVIERDYKVRGAALPRLLEYALRAESAYRIAVDALHHVDTASTELSDADARVLEEDVARKEDEKFYALVGESKNPPKAAVELTVGSVPPPQAEEMRKRVTDVVPGNRLMGPVEQLESLTLADFRRLSPNPLEAIGKMESLLQGLERVDYEERVRGILAWRKSPLAQLHSALIAESLNTEVAITEISARRRSQGQETLGPAEMQALAQWNEKIRF